MAIKLTYDTVRESFESKGYTLLSTEYVNNATKLNYKCPNGHEHSITWNSFSQGKRCSTCSDTKLTYEFVKESFENDGYILGSKEYINNKTKLSYECSKGHKHSMKWDNYKQGKRCPTCVGLSKPIIEYIRNSFEKEGYVLLTTEYINSKTKLDYICSSNHEHSMRWNGWQQGQRCPTCADIKHSIKYSGSNHPSWKGGISYEPYCPIWSDKEYKQDIRNRDGNKCLNPTCKKKDHRLHIHHINYNKKSCSPSNVITLCGSCNTTANNNREWHTAWYKALMYMRYNYK
jgi:hypothetical protein